MREKPVAGIVLAVLLLLGLVVAAYVSSQNGSGHKSLEYRSPSYSPPAPARQEDTGPALVVLSFDVKKVDYSIIHVKGSAKAQRDCSYAQISFTILNKSGNVVGSALDNISGLRKGESWMFDAIGTVNESGTRWDFSARVNSIVCW
jgi:hypothetical protein